MAEPILERDLAQMQELEVLAKAGDESARKQFFFLVSNFAKVMTKWQWIIHGDTVVYRQRAIRWLIRRCKYRQARRFAMCGRGDLGFTGDKEGSCRIRPKGCGARFCPRCSRRFGRRFLTRVASHLSSSPHEQIWHLVLTQRVIVDESLAAARDRFGKAWPKLYRYLRANGMTSALATYHIVPSLKGGWHYHCHLVAEIAGVVDGEALTAGIDAAWKLARRCDSGDRAPMFTRLVCGPGAAFVGLANDRQMEFWSESKDAVEVLLQYVMRDVLQGVEKWIGKLETDEQCEEFAAALAGAKLHRLYGVWRTRLVDESEAETAPSADSATVAKPVVKEREGETVWSLVGAMDEVLWKAKKGDVNALEFILRLQSRTSNRGAVAYRLLATVREIAGA